MSAGTSVGKFIGNTAAYAAHGAVVAFNATGQFGKDVVAGTSQQYSVKSAELATRRDAAVKAVVPVAPRQRKLATEKA